jgi:hypothetical protein
MRGPVAALELGSPAMARLPQRFGGFRLGEPTRGGAFERFDRGDSHGVNEPTARAGGSHLARRPELAR